MGKSPGKWIKAVLFGKKSSKSSLSKEVKILRSASEKATLVSAKELESTLSVEPPLVSHQNPSADAVIKDKLDSENGTVGADLPDEVVNSSSTRPSGDVDSMTKLGVPDDNERIRLEEAATKAQAAFRGYLARRAFRALKGIIRLQAVIRGHLVRRQAAATLYCIKGIIRLQALVRGRKVRHSDIGNKVRNNTSVGKLDAKCLDSSKTNGSSSWVEKKLLKNVFARKLKSWLPSAKPLQLQYNPEEQNSAWEWLQRWTISYVETKTPLSEPKNMSQKNEPRPKRGVRSVPNRKQENGSVHSVSEKPKTKAKANPRKVSNVVTEKLKQESEEPCLETELAGDEFLHCDQSFSRRGSLPAKYDDQENVVHNSPRLPSYMATTKSAKAKLKDHASSRFGVEKAEKNSLTRRHSLPSSSTGGGKMSSSPRVQRLVQASGKGGMKFDKSLSSSRDGNEKPVQAEWRR